MLWIESSLSFSLFLCSWHSWRGEIQNSKWSAKHYICREKFWMARSYSLAMFPPRESAPTTPVPREHGAENDICRKTWNVCNFLNIILDWLALFQMCVQTMYTDEWPSKGIPAAAQWNCLCRANLICGFVQTILGIEQICRALELGDEEEQHRGEWSPLCVSESLKAPSPDAARTWPRKMSPCRGNKTSKHYISAANNLARDDVNSA